MHCTRLFVLIALAAATQAVPTRAPKAASRARPTRATKAASRAVPTRATKTASRAVPTPATKAASQAVPTPAAIKLPKIVVFDTDLTLWPFWVGLTTNGTFTKDSTGEIIDSNGEKIKCFPEIPKVFQYLKRNKIPIGIFAATYNIKMTNELLSLFKLKDKIQTTVFYPVNDDAPPYKKMSKKSKIALRDMLIFENMKFQEYEKDYSVPIVEVELGVSMVELKNGLKFFSNL